MITGKPKARHAPPRRPDAVSSLRPGVAVRGRGNSRGSAVTAVVTALTIDVAGHPAPKGSKDFKGMRAGKPILVEHSPLLPDWTAAVVRAASARVRLTGWTKLTDECEVEIWAWFPRPKSVTRPYPSTRSVGDSDKIARGCLDPLVTAGVLTDDSLVVDLYVHERYSVNGTTGARIIVTPIAEGLL